MDMKRFTLDPNQIRPPTRDLSSGRSLPDSLPDAKEVKVHPRGSDGTENASLYFVGTATTILLVYHGLVIDSTLTVALMAENGRAFGS